MAKKYQRQWEYSLEQTSNMSSIPKPRQMALIRRGKYPPAAILITLPSRWT